MRKLANYLEVLCKMVCLRKYVKWNLESEISTLVNIVKHNQKQTLQGLDVAGHAFQRGKLTVSNNFKQYNRIEEEEGLAQDGFLCIFVKKHHINFVIQAGDDQKKVVTR